MEVIARFRHKNIKLDICVSTAIMNICKSTTLKEKFNYGRSFVEYKLERHFLSEEEKKLLVREAGYSYYSFERKGDESEIRHINEDQINDYIQIGHLINMCMDLFESMDEEFKLKFHILPTKCRISLTEKNEVGIFGDYNQSATYFPHFLKEILNREYENYIFRHLYVKWKDDYADEQIEIYGIYNNDCNLITTTCSQFRGMSLHKYIYLDIGEILTNMKNPYSSGYEMFYKNRITEIYI